MLAGYWPYTYLGYRKLIYSISFQVTAPWIIFFNFVWQPFCSSVISYGEAKRAYIAYLCLEMSGSAMDPDASSNRQEGMLYDILFTMAAAMWQGAVRSTLLPDQTSSFSPDMIALYQNAHYGGVFSGSFKHWIQSNAAANKCCKNIFYSIGNQFLLHYFKFI